MLHSEIVIIVDGDYAAGTLDHAPPPTRPLATPFAPGKSTFVSGIQAGASTYDFVFTHWRRADCSRRPSASAWTAGA